MADLRLILSQGRKRIGLLIGAGAPFSLRVDTATGDVKPDGVPIIPDVAGLTTSVLVSLKGKNKTTVEALLAGLGKTPNIEVILSRVRLLAKAIGSASAYGMNASEFEELAKEICRLIGNIVAPSLPASATSYSELVSWISGTPRHQPVEIFTTNYDLLFEEAFERACVPMFDGFSGSYMPFFDAPSIADDNVSPKWTKLWKLHGSVGWAIEGKNVVRGRGRNATELIYPEDLKYDQIRRLPYSALFERLKQFLLTPDTLLITCGFSFTDKHVCAILDETLAANANSAVLAFQFRKLEEERAAHALGCERPNFSVYAANGAVIRGVSGDWQFAEPPNKEWLKIRDTFWAQRVGNKTPVFTLGDFNQFARFCALSQSTQLVEQPEAETDKSEAKKGLSSETGVTPAA